MIIRATYRVPIILGAAIEIGMGIYRLLAIVPRLPELSSGTFGVEIAPIPMVHGCLSHGDDSKATTSQSGAHRCGS
jgi:hypothetical protein